MIRSNTWYLLMPLCVGITACTESRTPVDASSVAPAKSAAALAMDTEPTFESFPAPSELMERLRASLRDPVDTPEETQALQEVEAELGTFTYARPSTLVAVDPSVEAPMGNSFIEDGEWAAARVKALYGADMTVSCLTRPCIQYGDFDADGRRDLVVQVADDASDKSGVAFLMADQTHAVLGAGRASPLGDDLIWMDNWQVVSRSDGKGAAVVLGAASQSARAELSLTPGPGGSRTVTSAWSCTASSQVPVMTGPNTPRGIVTRSGIYTSTDEAWQAFDSNPNGTQWISETWTSNPVWIGYEFSDGPRQITRYSLRFINGTLTSRAPRDFQLQGSNGGDTWVTVDSRTNEINWGGNEERHYTVSTPGSYGKYRLYVTEDNDARAPIVAVSMGNITLTGANCDGSGGPLP
ncbi:MAG TPA: discoidin domain-containing protein [Archangium sp.]|uniref:discoidin domain-containing protein n=1 Tax=Archangium sp. TaxID=1872627 RepID=UPI002E33725D|nr:discoidin domain-containing protein [Archangium sp.]HEX5744757.1 discoidin domain-containing protein [Archangium sp.]